MQQAPFHQKATCCRHDIAVKFLLGVKQQSLVHNYNVYIKKDMVPMLHIISVQHIN
jgi:hypothetical protein